MKTPLSLPAVRQKLELEFAKSPEDRKLFTQLSQVLEQQQAYADLLSLLDQAIDRWPQDTDIVMSRSRIQFYLGDFLAAKAGYLKILQVDSSHIGAQCSLVMQGYGDLVGGFEVIESRLGDQSITNAERSRLCYAGAYLLEQAHCFDQAFSMYREANALRAAAGGMNIEAKQRGARAVIADVDAGVMQRLGGNGCESQRPVFIVGMPRSGTSLTEQVLAAHPDIHAAGERLFWGNIMGSLVKAAPRGHCTMAEAINATDPLVWQRAGDNYLQQMRDINATSNRITDKLPANFGLLPYIALIFPRARIIHLRREPLATIASCIRTPFADPQLAFSVEDWARFYGIYQALMDAWKPMLGEQLLEVNYEELVSDFPDQAHRLIDFLGLEWSESCLHPERQQRAVLTASAQQVRRPVHTGAIASWRQYESTLEALRPLIEDSRASVAAPPVGTA